MGVLPLEFTNGDSAETLALDGTEVFSLPNLGDDIQPGQDLDLVIQHTDGASVTVQAKVRIDTQIEVEYFRNGGILPYVLRQILQNVR
jgi:aconitate hydratase